MKTIEQRLFLLGLTKQDAAKKCKVSPTAFHFWITGENMPSPSNHQKLARVLGYTPSELLNLLQPSTDITPTPST